MFRFSLLLLDKEKEQLLLQLKQYQKLYMKMEVKTAYMTKKLSANTQYFGLHHDIRFSNLANTR